MIMGADGTGYVPETSDDSTTSSTVYPTGSVSEAPDDAFQITNGGSSTTTDDSDSSTTTSTSTDTADDSLDLGEDHTIGTGNSYIEDPMQGIEDLEENTDGDDESAVGDDGSLFVGSSDPDNDGSAETTAGGNEVSDEVEEQLTDEPTNQPSNEQAADPVAQIEDRLASLSKQEKAAGAALVVLAAVFAGTV